MQLSLEEELRLPSSDLRSHGWYHGPIPRSVAETLLTTDGQFLVRDCLSQVNDYVLSCHHSGTKLHFIINRVYILPNTLYERVQFQLEDDLFDTIADLVTFYVGNKQPITLRSGAHISKPVLRKVSLSVHIEAPPPPKPERNYSSTQIKERRILRKEYSKTPFKAVDESSGEVTFGSVEFSNNGMNECLLRKVQNELRDNGARVLARSLTLVHVRLLQLDTKTEGALGAQSCLEILSLPHGEKLRRHLFDRAEYLKLLVIASIAVEDNQEIALEILTKWIQIAAEVKSAFGDLFGFQCLMRGLMSPIVTSMKKLWFDLRQKNTNLALLFETKLRQEISALLDHCDSMAPNTCVPNVYFYVSLLVQLSQRLERIQIDKMGPDSGLGSILCHLELLRSLISQTERFRKNAQSVLTSVTSLDRSFAFFETADLIALFNTEDYKNFNDSEKKQSLTQTMDCLSRRLLN
ncbi:SH2 domain-containing protein 3C [Galendromus occidentalis]|uniref:SH2 domain-containing protein 3C n=1 Tax=Galendromus occidentalis TaxID=34638 RepID=A0AAJ6QVG7_9ACAR|nr:SH2 domain-containing protein 3C [Galendromus occidentalis]